MKQPRLSAIFVAISAASLLMASTVGFAGHKNVENFKGEANFKAEVPPPCPPIMMLHDGFYVGAGVGYDSYRVHEKNSLSATALGVVTFSQASSLSHSATGWMGGLFAGYGRYFDWFYLGAEISANASAAEGSHTYSNITGDSFNSKVKARSNYGIALLPGMKINDSTLLYIRLGYVRTNFKGSANSVFTDPTDGSITALSASSNNWRNGFAYGVGLESYVAEDVSIRGEFTHTSFNSKTGTGTFTDIDGDTLTASSKFEPSNNEFMLSLLYHFA